MPVPKKKKKFKSDSRVLCEAYIAEFGLASFESMVNSLKSYYYDVRRYYPVVREAIINAAHSYQASTDTHLTDGELKMILGHIINVSDWWSNRPPEPVIHEGKKKGQLQLFIPNWTQYEY